MDVKKVLLGIIAVVVAAGALSYAGITTSATASPSVNEFAIVDEKCGGEFQQSSTSAGERIIFNNNIYNVSPQTNFKTDIVEQKSGIYYIHVNSTSESVNDSVAEARCSGNYNIKYRLNITAPFRDNGRVIKLFENGDEISCMYTNENSCDPIISRD